MIRAWSSVVVALLIFAALLFAPRSCDAQVTTASHIVWTQSAPDLATANAYVYKMYADGSATGTPLTGVTCAAPTPPTTPPTFNCSTLIPAFTPGAHSIVLTATDGTLESPKSAPPATFTLKVVPSAPANVQVADAGGALSPVDVLGRVLDVAR